MAVTADIEAFVLRFFQVTNPNLFNINNIDNVLSLSIGDGMFRNPQYTINNIIFDLDENNVFLDYELNGNNYRLAMQIDSNQPLIINVGIFFSQFIRIYQAGLELQVLSKHENSFIFSNNNFTFSRV